MTKKFAVLALVLLFFPALAYAGLIVPSVATGSLTGSISPSGSVYATAPKTYTLTAGAGYTIDYVTNNSATVPSNQISGSGPWYYTVPLSASTQYVRVYYKLAAPTNPPYLLAKAPVSVTADINTPVTISGANSTILYLPPGTMAKFKWTSTPAGIFNPISSSVTSPAYIVTQFTAPAAGNYTATLTLTAPGAIPSSTNVAINVPFPGVSGSAYCLSCHSGWPEADAYVVSPHPVSVQGPTCQSCHNPNLALSHPGYSTSDTAANPGLYYSCVTCHYPGSTIVSSWPPSGLTFHNAYNGTNRCPQCHNPHTTLFNGNVPYPHFANSTTAAQFVNPNIGCDKCHVSAVDNSFNVYSANFQWARSGKGDPASPAYVAYQFKSRGTLAATPAASTSDDCVRCHTTTGYINYVSSSFTNIAPFATASGSREMIACPACHEPTPFDSGFSRREVGVQYPAPFNDGTLHVISYYGYSSAQSGKSISTKVFDDKGDSNVCIACHTGKTAGTNIKTVAAKVGASSAYWSTAAFMNPHYMAAASILFQVPSTTMKIGYEYRPDSGYNPSSNFAHPAIGDGVQGPCVGCHMNGSAKKHLFTPVSTATNGLITAITSKTCFFSNCHVSGSFTAAFLQGRKTGYQAALEVVAQQLRTLGIYFSATKYPYFFTDSSFTTPTTNWTRTINGTTFGSNIMGAAFNLKLLQSDGGAYTHNDWYAKRLLYDTLDFLDDGTQNDSVYTTIQNLSIGATTKSDAQNYLVPRP